MSNARIILRHLAYTGKGVPRAELPFEEGLNVIYGASNTGKTFAFKTLNFMFGGSDKLPEIEQREPYSSILLGMTVPDLGDVTLYRALAGGNLRLYNGLLHDRPANDAGRALGAKHQKGSDDTLSTLLLDLLGVDAKEVVASKRGSKESFTFRSMTPYFLVSEDAIMAERSPALSGQRTKESAERNILKALLSGTDDSAIVPAPKKEIRSALFSGKVEFIDELLQNIEGQLKDERSTRAEVDAELASIEQQISDLEGSLEQRQAEIDELVAQRRELKDSFVRQGVQVSELDMTLVRFTALDQVYRSDLQRLESIDEGGVLLLAKASRPCPLCGASVEHQHNDHGIAEARETHDAAKVEMQKIMSDREALRRTYTSVRAELEGYLGLQRTIQRDIDAAEAKLQELRPHEANLRQSYQGLVQKRTKIKGLQDLLAERERLNVRKAQLIREKKTSPPTVKLEMGPSGALGHELAMTIQDVLTTWQFPGNPTISFDLEAADIRLNGKPRTANGKGVRAILHAAVKVGILVFCHEKGLPHPGFLVLDTPLLTYREPLKNPKYGALAADEEALKKTPLQVHFYKHLASLRSFAQFIILENVDPPAGIAHMSMTVFTGEVGNGRFGLFP